MEVKIINKSHHPLPAYATELSAGMDIRANLTEPVVLKPLERKLIPTGLYLSLIHIFPDFLVEAVNAELILSMNNRDIPDLKISREYAERFQDYTGNKANQTSKMREAVQFVKQKLDSAQWFIDAIKQRQETLQLSLIHISL